MISSIYLLFNLKKLYTSLLSDFMHMTKLLQQQDMNYILHYDEIESFIKRGWSNLCIKNITTKYGFACA